MNYNDTVMDHFTNPRNVGGGPERRRRRAGREPGVRRHHEDLASRQDDRIEEAKFKTFGCGAAIANSSMMTEMVRGSRWGMPRPSRTRTSPRLSADSPIKMHCSSWWPTPFTRRSKTTRKEGGPGGLG